MSEPLMIAVVASILGPAVVGIIARMPAKKTNNKIDDVFAEIEKVSKSLKLYQTEEALKDFSSKTVRITQGNSLGVTIEEWLMSRSTLEILLPENEWPRVLIEEAARAQKIIRDGGLNG